MENTLENFIYRDVLNLKDFDFKKIDFNNLKQVNYDENSIQFKNIDFENYTFRLENKFIDKCRCEIDEHQKAMDRKSLNNEDGSYTKVKIVFKNCKFSNFIIKEKFIKDNISFDYNEKSNNLRIAKFIIFGSTLSGKFYINKQYSGNNKTLTIDSFKIENTVFEENFKLHNTNLDEFNIEDTDFNKHADFFKSRFLKGTLKEDKDEKINNDDIGFKAINFKGLALFGDTEFREKLIFKYVTFESFSHFRKAKLYKGLDLDYSNIQNEMNFFDIEKLDSTKAKNNTSQETFRIIKHNFNKIGNIIEANKYHSLELKKRRNQIKIFSADFFNYLVLFFHWITSNHSKNWIYPILWIFIIGFLTSWSLVINEHNFCGAFLEDIFKYISIINYDDCIKKEPLIFILNKVSLGYLYYQFLTAIRKDTRR
jgi:hypothetical protein